MLELAKVGVVLAVARLRDADLAESGAPALVLPTGAYGSHVRKISGGTRSTAGTTTKRLLVDMESTRFDALAKAVGAASSRRMTLRAVLGSLLALAGVAGAAEAAKKRRAGGRAEACIPTGKKCPSPEPRGKGKDKKKSLGCNQCCQRFVVTITNRKGRKVRKCSCKPAGVGCGNSSECCDGVCGDGVCTKREGRTCPDGAGVPFAFLREWGEEGTGDGQFDFPNGVAVHPSCDVYVADTGNDRIQVFRPVV